MEVKVTKVYSIYPDIGRDIESLFSNTAEQVELTMRQIYHKLKLYNNNNFSSNNNYDNLTFKQIIPYVNLLLGDKILYVKRRINRRYTNNNFDINVYALKKTYTKVKVDKRGTYYKSKIKELTKDIISYLEEHGPTSLIRLKEEFGKSSDQTFRTVKNYVGKAVTSLENKGRVRKVPDITNMSSYIIHLIEVETEEVSV